MAITGPKQKAKTCRVSDFQHRRDVELEDIIEDFGSALRNANQEYVAVGMPNHKACSCQEKHRMTPHMEMVWDRYVAHCQGFQS